MPATVSSILATQSQFQGVHGLQEQPAYLVLFSRWVLAWVLQSHTRFLEGLPRVIPRPRPPALEEASWNQARAQARATFQRTGAYLVSNRGGAAMMLSPEIQSASSVEELYPTTWKVAPGVCWIQCNDPKTAKRLSRVKEAKLVAEACSGGYLRTYELPWNLLRARRWVKRSVRSIYGAFSDHKQPVRAFEQAMVSSQRRNS